MEMKHENHQHSKSPDAMMYKKGEKYYHQPAAGNSTNEKQVERVGKVSLN